MDREGWRRGGKDGEGRRRAVKDGEERGRIGKNRNRWKGIEKSGEG